MAAQHPIRAPKPHIPGLPYYPQLPAVVDRTQTQALNSVSNTVRSSSSSAVPITVTSNYTVGSANAILLVDCSAGNITITLPAVGTNPGQAVTVKKIDASANVVNITPSGTNQIDNKTSLTLRYRHSAAELISDGVFEWVLV